VNALLNGITVLDFSEYIAGPYCGSLLADFGARVIKIEPPDGAEERRMSNARRYRGNTRMSLAFNRGKESIAIDLRQPAGVELVHRMVERADVVVQNFAPSVAEKLGIDYDTLAKRRPELIFLSSTAFGEAGPYRKRKGFDIIAHGASGVMANYADERGLPRGPLGVPYIDLATGIFNALAVVSALYHRERTGVGQKIETSLFSTGLALQAQGMICIDSLDRAQLANEIRILGTARGEGKTHTQVIDEFAELRLRHDQPDTARPIEVPDCLHRPTDRNVYPYYRVYATCDGYIGIAALNRGLREKLCAALQIVDPDIERNSVDLADEEYERQKTLMRTIEARLRLDSNANWLAKLEAAGVPCGPINYRSDLYEDPQVAALNMIWELANRDLGTYKAPGNPIRFCGTTTAPGKGAPSLGEHTDAILLEFGIEPAEVTRLRTEGLIR